MKIPKTIVIGAVLMILLGLARGVGGITLLIHGKDTLANIVASENTIRILAIGLILIGFLEIVSAIGVLRLKRVFWYSGIGVTIAFVIDGGVNGHCLFGKAGDQGTIVNIIVAALIMSCLLVGRRAFFGSRSKFHNLDFDT